MNIMSMLFVLEMTLYFVGFFIGIPWHFLVFMILIGCLNEYMRLTR